MISRTLVVVHKKTKCAFQSFSSGYSNNRIGKNWLSLLSHTTARQCIKSLQNTLSWHDICYCEVSYSFPIIVTIRAYLAAVYVMANLPDQKLNTVLLTEQLNVTIVLWTIQPTSRSGEVIRYIKGPGKLNRKISYDSSWAFYVAVIVPRLICVIPEVTDVS